MVRLLYLWYYMAILGLGCNDGIWTLSYVEKGVHSMKIGFTGTRAGMTTVQWEKVGIIIAESLDIGKSNEWHDGDCVGADEQAHGVVDTLKRLTSIETHGHPCNKDEWRANKDFDVMHEVLPPLVRNRVIVQCVDLMIAAPKEYENVKRGSGTWATMRYCYRQGRRMYVVWPDGTWLEHKFEVAEQVSLFD